MTKAVLSGVVAGALFFVSGLPLTGQRPEPGERRVEDPIDEDSEPSRHTFADLDRNRDKRLCPAEFDRLFELIGKKVADQDKEKIFKAWDADADGFISRTEFSANY